MGRSRGGFGTKIHLTVDSLWNPVEVYLSPGQDADDTHAESLLGEHRPEAVLEDKGHDSNTVIDCGAGGRSGDSPEAESG